MERNQAHGLWVGSVLTFRCSLIVRLCILEHLKLVVTFEILVCHVLFIFLFLLKGRYKMAVAGVLSFLMEKEENVDWRDRSFFKGEVTDRYCLAEMTVLCQTHCNSTCCQEALKLKDFSGGQEILCLLIQTPVLGKFLFFAVEEKGKSCSILAFLI